MAITQTREVARADMNDAYGVTCWQEVEMVDLTTDEARAYAEEILRAAEQADAIEAQDRDDAFGGQNCSPLVISASGEAVL